MSKDEKPDPSEGRDADPFGSAPPDPTNIRAGDGFLESLSRPTGDLDEEALRQVMDSMSRKKNRDQ